MGGMALFGESDNEGSNTPVDLAFKPAAVGKTPSLIEAGNGGVMMDDDCCVVTEVFVSAGFGIMDASDAVGAFAGVVAETIDLWLSVFC